MNVSGSRRIHYSSLSVVKRSAAELSVDSNDKQRMKA